MNVFYASDENYVRHATASMVSLMDHNKVAAEINIHMLSMGISHESCKAMQTLCDQFGRNLIIHELGDIRTWFDFEFDTKGFNAATMARLLIGRILPEDVDRIIYLDCDTIVTDDLTDLWNTDLTGCYLGMVAEPVANKKRRALLHMDDNQPYCNAGILLMNLSLWRQENAEKQVIDYYGAHYAELTAPDQDALNCSFAGKIRELPPRFNYGSVQIYYPWKAQKRISAPTPFMSEEDYIAGTAHPAIIHFLGEERPWRAGNKHPYTPEYNKYLSMTPWKDHPQDEGWRTYFRLFYLFNALVKPFPVLRYHIIDALIPAFMRYRAKALKKK